MREIKFRGESQVTGVFVYGYYVEHVGGAEYIVRQDKPEELVPIKAGSARQLVGRDKNGAEVYEGDRVWAEIYGNKYDWVARLSGSGVASDGRWIGHFGYVEVENG